MKEYLKIKFMSKQMMIKEINRIDEVVNQLAQVLVEQQNFLDELKKDNYKEKYRQEHKKHKELEKEANEIIENLTAELKKVERENRKLKRNMEVNE